MSTGIPAHFGDVRECISAARSNMDKIRRLLAHGSADKADECAAVLREIEVQLGCAVAILRAGGPSSLGPESRVLLEDLQGEVAVLAQLFAEADKLFSGWLRAVQSRRAGYNGRGQAAPLVLVSRMNVEG
jgi:hypothetical protein